MTVRQRVVASLLAAAVPIVVYGFTGGPPPRRTGAPVDDNGQTCLACHRTFSLNPEGGRVQVEAAPYRSGQRQTLRITVSHPEASKWGFQVTARLAANPAAKAGTFFFNPGGQVRIVCGNGQVVTETAVCGADQVEFASHGGNAESTFGGTNGTKTWEVDWTPPEGDVGDVIFYASGNAANNNNNNQGDRIYSTSLRIQQENTCNLLTSPRVTGIGNWATSRAGISSNSIVSLYGADFVVSGTRRTADAGIIRDNKYPRELGCIAVEVAGQRAPVLYVQQDQINIQMPSLTQAGTLPVRLILNPGRPSERFVDAGTVTVSNFGPALATFNGTSVAARHPDFSIAADPSVVPGGRPARRGDVILLYATGLGETTPTSLASGDIAPNDASNLYRVRNPVTVTIGGTTVPDSDVQFAGLTPGSITGLYQLNVRVPSTAAAGNTPITISVGGIRSPEGTTIPIAAQ